MKSAEAYKVIRAIAFPWAKERGFKAFKSSYLTYARPGPTGLTFLQFQCHHQGWERHKGSKFTVWLETGSNGEPEPSALVANRLTARLGLKELEFIRARQNKIISSIPQPPAEYVSSMVRAFERAFRDPVPMVALYLSDWQLVDAPYSPSDDIWFRYFTPDDVRAWTLVLLSYLNAHVGEQNAR